MGVGVRPSNVGAFSTFLKAQETSPTLVLAHAKLGDEGALEVAHFVAASRHLVFLDLTGNDITSTGAQHLAEAIRQCVTLESVVLKHNRVTANGEAGIVALCRAFHDNGAVRHVDLRHNGLAGAEIATLFGQMLQDNPHLTHLELSWNPLDPSAGQILCEHMQMNTTLFDCQLTGCNIAEQTLLNIAQILHRNRKANGADMKAGPYKLFIERGHGAAAAPRGDAECHPRGLYANEPVVRSSLTSKVVSEEVTNELIVKLHRVRADEEASSETARYAEELIGYLDGFQKQLGSDRDDVTKVRERVAHLLQGHQDREQRYRGDIARAQDKLLDYEKERKQMQAVLGRLSEELNLQRERSDQAALDLEKERKHQEGEEARSSARLAEILVERREVERRLTELQEQSAHQEIENKKLRGQVGRIRENLVTLRPNP